MRPALTAFATFVLLGWAAVLTLFIRDTSRLGGDALAGGHEPSPDGAAEVWYVSDHGKRSIVSEADWRSNRVLAVGVLGGLPVMMAGLFYVLFAQVFRRRIYRRDDDDVAAGVRRVRATGPAIAAAKTGARLGGVGFGGKIVRVEVRPGGLLVKPPFLAEFAVAREHVRAVERKTVWRVPTTIVTHTSPDARSPVVLEGREDPAFAAALDELAQRG